MYLNLPARAWVNPIDGARHPLGVCAGWTFRTRREGKGPMAETSFAESVGMRREIEITTIGRRSGREISLPVWCSPRRHRAPTPGLRLRHQLVQECAEGSDDQDRRWAGRALLDGGADHRPPGRPRGRRRLPGQVRTPRVVLPEDRRRRRGPGDMT